MNIINELTQDELFLAIQVMPNGKTLNFEKIISRDSNHVFDLYIKELPLFHQLSSIVYKEKRRKLMKALLETDNNISITASMMNVSIDTINRNMLMLHLI